MRWTKWSSRSSLRKRHGWRTATLAAPNRTCIYKAYIVRKTALTAGDNAKDTPCSDTVGAAQAAIYVKDCIAVATGTHPPCNADNTCELIVSHNIFGCTGLGGGAPKFCAAYVKPGD